MAYRLTAGESVAEGVRRVAAEQIAVALEALSSAEDRDTAVHEARKALKKLRGLLRLVRGELGETVYRRENLRFRDLGRELSTARDRWVFVETVRALEERFGDAFDEAVLEPLRRALEARHEETVRRLHDLEEGAVGRVLAGLEEARAHVASWPLQRRSFDALATGLRAVYGRGRRARAAVEERPDVEALHEWRKRVKYLWYHCRLLHDAWPPVLGPLAAELHRLSDLLGDDHDLAELGREVERAPELCPGDRAREVALTLVRRRRRALLAPTQPLGRRIYAETPDAFVARCELYWRAWRGAGSQLSAS